MGEGIGVGVGVDEGGVWVCAGGACVQVVLLGRAEIRVRDRDRVTAAAFAAAAAMGPRLGLGHSVVAVARCRPRLSPNAVTKCAWEWRTVAASVRHREAVLY